MAKFSDYNQTDELQDEIQEAAEASQERVDTLPERFRGKSAEDIAKSYVELEKMNSRQAQDLGEMRKQVDQLVREFEQSKAEPEVEEPLVSIDELYASPEQSIEKVVRKVIEPTLAEQREEKRQRVLNERIGELDQKYDGWRDVVQGSEFQEWIRETPYRARLAAAADKFDVDAATDLLEQYYDVKRPSQKRRDNDALRQQQLRDAGLETGGAAYSEPAETYSRTDLINKRIRAKRGDQEAERWLKANYNAIAAAYEDGRVTD